MVPVERILLETDAPHLVPPSIRRNVSQPWMIWEVAKFITRQRGSQPRAILDQANHNAIAFYSLVV